MHRYSSSISYQPRIVPDLPNTIRTIRQRLGQTMSDFAESLGTDQSTVSRYEAGQVTPSRTVLILMFLLASEPDRDVIRAAMGEVSEAALLARYRDAEQAIRGLSKRSDSTRVAFAEESAAILHAKDPIDPTLIELLRLFRTHARNRKLRSAVAQMLPYFRFLADQKS